MCDIEDSDYLAELWEKGYNMTEKEHDEMMSTLPTADDIYQSRFRHDDDDDD